MTNQSTQEQIKALDFKLAGLIQNIETISITFDLIAKSQYAGEKCGLIARSLDWLNTMASGLVKEKESIEKQLKTIDPTRVVQPTETPKEDEPQDESEFGEPSFKKEEVGAVA